MSPPGSTPVPSVPAACQASELLGAEGCTTNGFENFDKISFWKTPTTKCADGGDWLHPVQQVGRRLHRHHGRAVETTNVPGTGDRKRSPVPEHEGNAMHTKLFIDGQWQDSDGGGDGDLEPGDGEADRLGAGWQ
ncbi:MAG: hypothetical protein U0X20_26625 [Caldilineaceae bacterium]